MANHVEKHLGNSDTEDSRTKRSRVTESRLQRKESSYLVAKLAFHAKESPIRTRVESSVFISSQPTSPAHGEQAGRPRTPESRTPSEGK